ncbi:MAG: endo alpha-1,4 polygalactosaminidase [Eubacteriales bacterium]
MDIYNKKNTKNKNVVNLFNVAIIFAFVFFLMVNVVSCTNKLIDFPNDTDPNVIEKNYVKLTTGGPNAPYEVRFGDVTPEECEEYKDLNVLVIDTAFGNADDIKVLHENGNKRVLVYINVGALDTNFVTDGRFDDLKLEKYEGWDGEFWVDIRNQRWQEFIYEQAEYIKELGADGFFVDNLDVYGNYAKKEGMYEAACEILDNLAKIKPDIMINGADVFVRKAISENFLDKNIFCVNQEEINTRADASEFKELVKKENGKSKEYRDYIKKCAEQRVYYDDYLSKCKDYGLSVYLIEYGFLQPYILENIKKNCEEDGYTYYVSRNIDLNSRWRFR